MPPKEPRSFWTISRSSRQQTLSWPLDHSVGKLCGFMQLRGIFSGTRLQNPVRYGMINTVILDMLLFAIAIIIVILLQEGSQKNLGVVTGGADTFLSKNKARSVDAFLARWTKFIAIGFFVLVIVTNIILYFVV